MGGNVPDPTAGSLILSLVTVAIILVINIFTKGFFKSISILIGLVIGTTLAAFMGLVDFAPVVKAPFVHVPTAFLFWNANVRIHFNFHDVYYRDGFHGRVDRGVLSTF